MSAVPSRDNEPANDPRRAMRAIALPYWLREFALIRSAVLLFAFTLACAAAAVTWSYWQAKAARADEAAARLARNAAHDRLENVEAEKNDIQLFQPQYAALRDRGLIGEENRLAWLEAIRQIQEQRHLPSVSYEIAPQQAVKLEARIDTGQYRLRASRMHVHMELLHEGDLFAFFGDLRERSFFTVQDCAIKRAGSGPVAVAFPDAVNGGGIPLSPAAQTLTADCTLNWLTLAPAAPRAHAGKGTP